MEQDFGVNPDRTPGRESGSPACPAHIVIDNLLCTHTDARRAVGHSVWAGWAGLSLSFLGVLSGFRVPIHIRLKLIIINTP